ncbi:hypothetical protein FNU76_16335 [Chitinimonas arctica]|uniref:Uncharacterized protein n=1 Tax=Chitinimonas arctica TaxID=2594795 RepID=A0A516SIC0_9NEIS|nr:hypothetical protein [Chitinimonas arctica]QDQ27788.1 hypothetical protein FNU76_16335 [Chitinimonas arctica]
MQSFRAFFFDAIKHPEQGGYAYGFAALEQLDHCLRAIKPAPGPPPLLDAEQQAAKSTLMVRCDLSEDELNAARGQLAHDIDFTRDPLLTLVERSLRATGPAAKSAIAHETLALADPAILRSLQASNMEFPAPNAQGPRYYLAGRWYEGKESALDMEQAWALANCELGMDCGPDTTATLVQCVQHGWCADNLQDAVRIGLGADRYDRVSMLRQQIISAVKRRDAAVFSPPP